MPKVYLKPPVGDEPVVLTDINTVLLRGDDNTKVPFAYTQDNKSLTLSSSSGTILPDDGYGGIAEVNYSIDFDSFLTSVSDFSLDFNPEGTVLDTIEIPFDSDLYEGLSSATIARPIGLIADNIRSGITIAGIEGNYSGSPSETKTVELDFTDEHGEILQSQVVNPTPGKVLSQVTITKPAGLISSNIVADVIIGGVEGTVIPFIKADDLIVTPSTSQQSYTLSGGQGYQSVTVQAVGIKSAQTIIPNNSQQTITPNVGQLGIASVTVQAVPVQNPASAIQPSTSQQTVVPATGKYFNQIQVAAVTSAIDSDIQAENIRYDPSRAVSILGVEGTFTKVGSGESPALNSDILAGKVAWSNGVKRIGSMTNNGDQSASISLLSQQIELPVGYISSGTISISATEQHKITPSNIRYDSNLTILGVSGTFSASSTISAGQIAAGSSQVLSGYSAFIDGEELQGSMTDVGTQISTISSIVADADRISIANGYHDGNGAVSISSVMKSRIIPENIRQGVNILGIDGAMSGSEDVISTSPNITPSPSVQSYQPSQFNEYVKTKDTTIVQGKTYYTRSGEEGHYIYTEVQNPIASELDTYYEYVECNYLSGVTINAIPYAELENEYNGITIVIGN